MTFQTIANGHWNDPLVWSGNIVPPYTSSDSFIINDSIRIDNDLFFTGAYIQIDSTGGLCGHYEIDLTNGTIWKNYGYFEFDTMNIVSSILYNYTNGTINYLLGIHLTGSGGNLESTGAINGGYWDTCFGNNKIVDTVINHYNPPPPEIICSATLNPTLSQGNFTLSYIQPVQSTFILFDDIGRKVFESNLTGESSIENFNLNNFANGLYLWEVINENGICNKGKLEIMK
jgi:hypothetical protein